MKMFRVPRGKYLNPLQVVSVVKIEYVKFHTVIGKNVDYVITRITMADGSTHDLEVDIKEVVDTIEVCSRVSS